MNIFYTVQNRLHASPLLRGMLLVLLIIIVYIPAMQNGFIWDDDDNLTENIAVRSFEGLAAVWSGPVNTQQFYPLVHTSFLLEYQLWGYNPLGYHIDNILLHALGVLFLYLSLLRLSVAGAFVAALLFAIHPVTVESVAWITERKNTLSGLFFFASLYTFIRARLCNREEQKQNNAFYYLSLFFFFLALSAKTVTCVLPILLFLLLWWKKENLSLWQKIRPLLPFFALAVSAALVTIHFETGNAGAEARAGEVWQLTLPERFINAGYVAWFYLFKLACPLDLSFIYPQWSIDAKSLLSYFAPLSFGALLLASLFFQKRVGKAPAVALFWYSFCVGPSMGVLNFYFMRYSFVQDHFAYLGSVAPIVFTVAFMTQTLKNLHTPQWILPLSAGLLLTAALVITVPHQKIYASAETLWSDTIRKNPNAWMAQFNLGMIRYQQKKTKEALMHLFEAMRLLPHDARITYNIATIFLEMGKPQKAEKYFLLTLKNKGENTDTLLGLGAALAKQNKMAGAVNAFKRVLQADPDNKAAKQNMLLLLQQMRR